jgi:protein-arginine kinase activator protein McsA
METQKLIKENTKELHQAYVDGEYTIKELEELHKTAISDEEFEIAVSIRDVLNMIK